MAQRQSNNDGAGCWGLLAVLIVIGLILAAIVSVAALVDPFSNLPPIGAIFGHCEDKVSTPGDECDLATRYPGFYGHVALSFGWTIVTVLVLLILFGLVAEMREARSARFADEKARELYARRRLHVAGLAACGLVLAALPIIDALV